MTRSPMSTWLLALLIVSGCSPGPLEPAALDTKNEACRHCRMMVSDIRFAAQIVAPGDEPLFFDDVGCLRDFLRATPAARDAAAFVADHRSGDWVPAGSALYTPAEGLETPMGSGLVAHADRASRDADAVVRGPALTATDVFGPGLPGGTR